MPDHWFPKNSNAQARVDEYLEWQHLNMRINATYFFAEKYLLPLRTKQPINERRAANFLKGYKTCLQQVEDIWLKDRPFVGGPEISIADLLATAEMEQTGNNNEFLYKTSQCNAYMQLLCTTSCDFV